MPPTPPNDATKGAARSTVSATSLPAVDPGPEAANSSCPEPPGPLDSTSLLTTITTNLVGMIYRCRVDPAWTMEFVSDGCLKLTGYRPDELIFNNRVSYEQITHPEDRERVRSAILASLARHNRFDLEYRIVRAGADGRA